MVGIFFAIFIAIFMWHFVATQPPVANSTKIEAKIAPTIAAKIPAYYSGYIVLMNNEICEIANYIYSTADESWYELRKLHQDENSKTFSRTANEEDYIIAEEKSFCLKTKDAFSDFMDIKWVSGEESKYNARQNFVAPELLLDI